jgi:uncharacterized protein with LGFP repeats
VEWASDRRSSQITFPYQTLKAITNFFSQRTKMSTLKPLKPGSLNPGGEVITILKNQEAAKQLMLAKAATLPWIGAVKGDLVVETNGYSWPFENATLFASADSEGAATAAFELHGDIIIKYLGQGGVHSGIGYPTSDEAWTADKICRFNNFATGAIYWTPETGACMIYGEIYKKWVLLGGEGGPASIGYPVTDEMSTADKTIRHNNFKNGAAIYYSPQAGACLIYGDIYKKWVILGSEASSGLGYPITDEQWTADKVCRYNNFSLGGAIYWTPALGPFFIYGDIYRKWMAQGGEGSGIGYPITDETSTPDKVCRYNTFKNGGAIYWTPQHGAFLIYGEIYKKWISLGGEEGTLGYPLTDETSSKSVPGGRYNKFSKGGSLLWTPADGVKIMDAAWADVRSKDFNKDITSGGLAALGGWTVSTIRDDGTFVWRGVGHDSGADGYHYSATVYLHPVPGKSLPPIVMVHSGLYTPSALMSPKKKEYSILNAKQY